MVEFYSENLDYGDEHAEKLSEAYKCKSSDDECESGEASFSDSGSEQGSEDGELLLDSDENEDSASVCEISDSKPEEQKPEARLTDLTASNSWVRGLEAAKERMKRAKELRMADKNMKEKQMKIRPPVKESSQIGSTIDIYMDPEEIKVDNPIWFDYFNQHCIAYTPLTWKRSLPFDVQDPSSKRVSAWRRAIKMKNKGRALSRSSSSDSSEQITEKDSPGASANESGDERLVLCRADYLNFPPSPKRNLERKRSQSDSDKSSASSSSNSSSSAVKPQKGSRSSRSSSRSRQALARNRRRLPPPEPSHYSRPDYRRTDDLGDSYPSRYRSRPQQSTNYYQQQRQDSFYHSRGRGYRHNQHPAPAPGPDSSYNRRRYQGQRPKNPDYNSYQRSNARRPVSRSPMQSDEPVKTNQTGLRSELSESPSQRRSMKRQWHTSDASPHRGKTDSSPQNYRGRHRQSSSPKSPRRFERFSRRSHSSRSNSSKSSASMSAAKRFAHSPKEKSPCDHVDRLKALRERLTLVNDAIAEITATKQ
ncbi:hypothetical protein Ciccas_001960 [Cichlidogyrus casuarinus]|uniref:Uncharacterized protein n=1 Tax=Cichlidogyrus casuarinus TaxID=1844966 RepID=A0ABD2QKU2_9PLAT